MVTFVGMLPTLLHLSLTGTFQTSSNGKEAAFSDSLLFKRGFWVGLLRGCEGVLEFLGDAAETGYFDTNDLAFDARNIG